MEPETERFEMMTKKNPAARALGRLGGKAGTTKQNEARKRNAQRAGRPRRVCTTCGEPVVGGHVDRALDASCGTHGWRWQRRDDPVDPPTSTDEDARRIFQAMLDVVADMPVATRDDLEQRYPTVFADLRQRAR